jgi:catechol 2,3-dioxygenase-like lactoylglutathione lyase family enzyme
MQVRFARHTDRLDAIVNFYRDGLGLAELGSFRDHDGYDGVFLGLPGTDAHLEFTSGGDRETPAPHPESLLVLYLGDAQTVDAIVSRVGSEPVEPTNPYWKAQAVTLADPDGFGVVLVPAAWPQTG